MFIARRAADPARLTRGKEFEAVLANGLRLSARHFVVRAAPNPGGTPRLGLIAGRKAAKRAVDRNRAKRLAREMFRAARPQLPAWDVVFQLRDDLRAAGNHEISAELSRLLQQVQRRAAVQS